MKNRSRFCLLALAVACQGCSEGAKLLQASECESVIDILDDIGAQLRHVIYHVYTPRYYRYLWPERTSDLLDTP